MVLIANLDTIPKQIIEKMQGVESIWFGDTGKGTSCNKIACRYTVDGDSETNSVSFFFIFTRENNPEKKNFASLDFKFCAIVVDYQKKFWARKFKNEELTRVKSVVLDRKKDAISDLGLVVENIFNILKYVTPYCEKEVKEKQSRSIIFMLLPFIFMLLPFMIMYIPLHPMLLDIFIVLCIIYELLLLILAFFIENVKKYSLFPTKLFLCVVFNLTLNNKITSFILTKGSEINVRLIKELSSLITSLQNERPILCLVIFIFVIILNMIVITKIYTRTAKVSARFSLNSLTMQNINQCINMNYINHEISEEEAIDKKEKVWREGNFFSSLDGVNKLVSGHGKIGLFIIGLSFIGIIFIQILQNDRSIKDVINTYLPLIIANGIIFILLSFLTSLTMGVVIKKERLHGFPFDMVKVNKHQVPAGLVKRHGVYADGYYYGYYSDTELL